MRLVKTFADRAIKCKEPNINATACAQNGRDSPA